MRAVQLRLTQGVAPAHALNVVREAARLWRALGLDGATDVGPMVDARLCDRILA
jgi:hypothetical protein